MTPSEKHASIIKSTATRLGFEFCRIAKAEFLEEEAPRLEYWVNQNYQGQMGFFGESF